LSPSGADSADRSRLAVLGAAPYLKNKHNQADLSVRRKSNPATAKFNSGQWLRNRPVPPKPVLS
jgi:hypothetical protein